jgi:hypothetical protein
VFAFAREHRAAGLSPGALYLMRPDSYVALADPDGDPAALQRYFTARQLRPATAKP